MSSIDELVRQVQELEDATTDLLDATNISKQVLDEAVDSATGSAGSASNDASTATSKAGEAVSARNEAVKAKEDAEAIVYEGDATTTPTGGAIPVAYADGQIDSGWLPEFRARFPYSGVIGSVDKTDVFQFGATTDWANKIRLLPSRFNIAGKFVEKTSYQTFQLPEAESTADRAIAFDDVFLDWSGNVDAFRSVTPHRTTTGYDADEIAKEHGYSKVSTGLYKKGDSYALLLCRVARRNHGCYEPLLNPEGVIVVYEQAIGTPYFKPWHNSLTRSLDSKEDCFAFGSSSEDSSRGSLNWGRIGASSTTYARPDKKQYDAIYEDDVTPLYYSAQKVTDRQALLFDSFNRAVAGETFMGAEGTNYVPELVNQSDYSQSETLSTTGSGVTIHSDRIEFNGAPRANTAAFRLPLPLGAVIDIEFNITVTEGELRILVYGDGPYDGNLAHIDSSGSYTFHHIVGELTSDYAADSRLSFYANDESSNTFTITNLKVKIEQEQASARPQFLAVDIIGALNAMPPEWLEHGLPGNWLAVGEEGEDLIPDGTNKHYKLSRKCLECYLVLYTEDNGASWSDISSSGIPAFESARNSWDNRAWPANRCVMVFYRTAANPFELTGSLAITAIKDMWTGQSQHHLSGCLLTSNLINKIPIGADAAELGYLPLSRLPLYRSTLNGGVGAGKQPEHGEIYIREQAATQRVTKVLPYLTDEYKLAVVYKELKYESIGNFGDDLKFQVVSNQTTVTDLNGKEVIVGQKVCTTPFQFDGVTL